MQVVLSSEDLYEQPVEVEGIRTLLVKDGQGNPIFLAMQQNDENIWAITPDDPKFKDVIKELGITKRLTIKKSFRS